MQIFRFYLVFINVLTFAIFGIDKWLAKRSKWRLPESRMLLACLIGGSVGGLIAMQTFRHKTQKLKFKLGIPLIIIAQLALILLVIKLAYIDITAASFVTDTVRTLQDKLLLF